MLFQYLGAPRMPVTQSTTLDAGPVRLIVLPFENLSRQPDDEWLGGAFSDSLTLGLRDAHNIVLVNREGLLDFNQNGRPDTQQISRALGVRYYVNGSYQRVGADLRVVARLVDVGAGTIRLQESFTDEFANLLRIEDDLARRFAAALEQSPATTTQVRTSSLSAYQALAQANDLYLPAATAMRFNVSRARSRRTTATRTRGRCSARATRGSARQTTSTSPSARTSWTRRCARRSEPSSSAPPYTRRRRPSRRATKALEQVDAWRGAARKAIELNPRLAEGYVLYRRFLRILTRVRVRARSRLAHRGGLVPQGAAAESVLRRGLRPSRHRSLLVRPLGGGTARGGCRAAAAAGQRCAPTRACRVLLWLGRADETEQQLRRLAARTPPNVLDDWLLTGVRLLAWTGRGGCVTFPPIIERGAVIVREIDTGRLYANVGRLQDAAVHLEHAFAMDPSCARCVAQNPEFAAYRDDPARSTLYCLDISAVARDSGGREPPPRRGPKADARRRARPVRPPD